MRILKKDEWYEGLILNDKPEGIGCFKDGDGRLFSGKWKNGVKEGIGMIETRNGDLFVGIWENG